MITNCLTQTPDPVPTDWLWTGFVDAWRRLPQAIANHAYLMSYRSNDYECPEHGRFDRLVDRADEESPQPCPECNEPSPWVFPAPMGRMALGGVTFERGKNEAPPRPTYMNTSALADGTSLRDWRKSRSEMWRQHRLRQIRNSI